MVVYLISQPGSSMWLRSYWISQAGVEEPKPHFITAWPHKHPENLVEDFFVKTDFPPMRELNSFKK